MITIPDLQTALLDLLHEVEGTEIRPIIGGGYGIYLRIEHVRRLDVRTLLHEWPEPRSTNDLDLFLRPELLIHSAKLKPLGEIGDVHKIINWRFFSRGYRMNLLLNRERGKYRNERSTTTSDPSLR